MSPYRAKIAQVGRPRAAIHTIFAAVNFLHRLQQRWKVKNLRTVIVILLVFALTGTSVMLLKRVLAEHVFEHARWFTYTYYWLVLPFYNLLLLFYGWVFGQGRFFWEFEKRFFARLGKLLKY